MSAIPTPETDAAYKYWPSKNSELVDAGFARKLERERDEARQELEDHLASTIHTCHDKCKRAMCVLRRERDELRSQRDGAREVARFWREQYAEVHPNHQWVSLPWEDRE